MEEEIQALQAGEERRGSCASQSNECCFDPAMVEQFLTMGAAHAEQYIQAFNEGLDQQIQGSSHYCAHGKEEKREEENGKRSKRKERPVNKWVHERQGVVTKASWLVSLWILLGTRMQMVKAVEEEISIRRKMDRMIEKVHALHAGGGMRYKRMKTCERGRKGEGDWQREKR